MIIKPLRDLMVVRPDDAVDKTEGGIVLPDHVKKRQPTGIVMSVGKDVSSDIGVGDRVLFGEFAGVRVNINDTEMYIMKEGDTYGKEIIDSNMSSI